MQLESKCIVHLAVKEKEYSCYFWLFYGNALSQSCSLQMMLSCISLVGDTALVVLVNGTKDNVAVCLYTKHFL